MSDEQLITTAKDMREKLGGTIFSFPIDADNQFSPYAVVVYAYGQYTIFPQAEDIHFATLGILEILKQFEKRGWNADYAENVRLIFTKKQIDAPSTTMRRLKKDL